MKTYLFVILCLCNLSIYGQSSRKLSPYYKLSIGTGLTAEYIIANQCRIEIGDSQYKNDDFIKTEVKQGKLSVSVNPNSTVSRLNTLPRLRIYGPALKEIETKASSILTVKDTMRLKSMVLKINSSSSLKGNFVAKELELIASSSAIGNLFINAENTRIQASSSANLKLSGFSQKISIVANSSASVKASKLRTEHSKLEANSVAEIYTWTTSTLNAQANTQSNIYYYGEPKQKIITKSTDGNVRKK